MIKEEHTALEDRHIKFREEFISNAQELSDLNDYVIELFNDCERVKVDSGVRTTAITTKYESMIQALASQRKTTPEAKVDEIAHLIRPLLIEAIYGTQMTDRLEIAASTVIEDKLLEGFEGLAKFVLPVGARFSADAVLQTTRVVDEDQSRC